MLSQSSQHEVHKVGEDAQSQLGAVQRDGSAPSPVASVQHPQSPPLPQNPHVRVQNHQRARAYEDHLLAFAPCQLLLPARPANGVVPWLRRQTERDQQRHSPGEQAQQPGPAARREGGSVAQWVAHGAEAVQSHDSERQQDVGGAADQQGDHRLARGAAGPRAHVDLVVEDAVGAHVDQRGHQQVKDQHEARLAAQTPGAHDGPVDDEVEEEEQRE